MQFACTPQLGIEARERSSNRTRTIARLPYRFQITRRRGRPSSFQNSAAFSSVACLPYVSGITFRSIHIACRYPSVRPPTPIFRSQTGPTITREISPSATSKRVSGLGFAILLFQSAHLILMRSSRAQRRHAASIKTINTGGDHKRHRTAAITEFFRGFRQWRSSL